VFVDSSAWLALVSATDGQHAEADRLFGLALDERVPLVTSNLVVAEVHRLLLHRAGIRPATTFLERIEASDALTVEFATLAHHKRARAWLTRLADQVVSYTDAVSFAVIEAVPCRAVLTFDADFDRAGFARYAGS
jgi:predicted nucleic acid-binding protein